MTKQKKGRRVPQKRLGQRIGQQIGQRIGQRIRERMRQQMRMLSAVWLTVVGEWWHRTTVSFALIMLFDIILTAMLFVYNVGYSVYIVHISRDRWTSCDDKCIAKGRLCSFVFMVRKERRKGRGKRDGGKLSVKRNHEYDFMQTTNENVLNRREELCDDKWKNRVRGMMCEGEGKNNHRGKNALRANVWGKRSAWFLLLSCFQM